MARARNIKPGLFKNEVLGTLDPFVTLLFAGLWTLADKSGILEDRPLRIKAELFPYRDGFDINGYLTVLEREGFIHRYEHAGIKLLQIAKFREHQNPHHTEKDSIYPDYSTTCDLTVNSPLNNGCPPADSLNTDSLIPDSLIPDSPNTDSPIPDVVRETSSAPKNGTRLPADWLLPSKWGQWALENTNLTESEIRLEAEKFKDHWLANANRASGRKADWQATWRNWVRNAKPDKTLKTKTQQIVANNDKAISEFIGSGQVIEGEFFNA